MDELYRLLAAGAVDAVGERAALALLHRHGYWLDNAAFVTACINRAPAHDGTEVAWVAWRRTRNWLGETPCSEDARRVLLMACDLAEDRALRLGARGAIEERVLRWAYGLPGHMEPVVDLVRGEWFANRDFVDQCVVHLDDVDGAGPPISMVDWVEVGRLVDELTPGKPERARQLRAARDLATAAWATDARRADPGWRGGRW